MQKEKRQALEERKAAEKNAAEGRAYLKYARISPRKVEIVLNLIRGKDTDTAMAILKNTQRGASEYLVKLLKSAVANAEHKNAEKALGMDTTNLYVAECFVCPGPTLKRIMARAQGRAFHILKRTSHVTMVVREKKEVR
ncbi:MAG: 50S ribosomal protein L22 [Clostridia bacterium]|nr:50S ribosomal protein L22 [Clostridia bacterium]